LQRAERRANASYDASFKQQLSQEDKKAKRKQILSSIGEWKRRRRRDVVAVVVGLVEGSRNR
jgi:hypothetical protein